jgi:hypothetical protein
MCQLCGTEAPKEGVRLFQQRADLVHRALRQTALDDILGRLCPDNGDLPVDLGATEPAFELSRRLCRDGIAFRLGAEEHPGHETHRKRLLSALSRRALEDHAGGTPGDPLDRLAQAGQPLRG